VNVQSTDWRQWKIAQETDPELELIYNRLSTGGERPTSEEMAGKGYEARYLWALWNQLLLHDGDMFVRCGPNYTARLVVPLELIQDTLSRLHNELGHCGINKLELAARARIW
jgi:hypothetical protein